MHGLALHAWFAAHADRLPHSRTVAAAYDLRDSHDPLSAFAACRDRLSLAQGRRFATWGREGTPMLATFFSLVLAAAALAQQAPRDILRGDDLSRLKTFGFETVTPDSRPTEENTTYDSPIMDERTTAAIAAQLESRGLRRNDKNPDVWVVAHRTFRTERTFYPFPDPWLANGWGWPYGGSRYVFDQAIQGRVYLRRVIRGRLTIDVRNATSGALLWRGVGGRRAHQTSTPSHREKRVDDEVADVFESFPLPAR
jgi:hypothetical protein